MLNQLKHPGALVSPIVTHQMLFGGGSRHCVVSVLESDFLGMVSLDFQNQALRQVEKVLFSAQLSGPLPYTVAMKGCSGGAPLHEHTV